MSNKPDVNIFWFRRDLRLNDNAGLYFSLKSEFPVLPLFIFDSNILSQLQNKKDPRVEFIYNSIIELRCKLEENGSRLMIECGKPVDVFKKLIEDYNIHSVYTNHDYEPYAIDRDEKVSLLLIEHGISYVDFKDQVIFEKNEIIKDNGKPYTIYTPYSKKWKIKLNETSLEKYPSQTLLSNLFQTKPAKSFSLEEIGFTPTGFEFPPKTLKKEILGNYGAYRDFPFMDSTSRLSVHLRFGTISIRDVVQKAMQHSEVWLNELIWREFFMMILYHFSYVVDKPFRPEYEYIQWRNDENEFLLWCDGKTGYPLVDAGMRELHQTGFMHNRVRMITASFLTKHLLIDWRWGAQFFSENLIDYELASNNGNWQWAAGCGCDAVPYFRIFNPLIQQKKFDPDLKYIKKWIPEYGTHEYPEPIVEHNFARERAINTYKTAISKFKNYQ